VAAAVLLNPVQVTLGMLVDSVPRDAVDDAITACGVRERRSDGKLPAHVITYLTLGLALFPDDVETRAPGVLHSLMDACNNIEAWELLLKGRFRTSARSCNERTSASAAVVGACLIG